MPVNTGSAGVCLAVGFSGKPAVSRSGPDKTGGPPSMGSPRPFHARPSQASLTLMLTGRPMNATVVSVGLIPDVPS